MVPIPLKGWIAEDIIYRVPDNFVTDSNSHLDRPGFSNESIIRKLLFPGTFKKNRHAEHVLFRMTGLHFHVSLYIPECQNGHRITTEIRTCDRFHVTLIILNK